MNETIYSKLEENLERLKLKQMHLHLNEASKQSVVGDTSFVEILYNLTEHELQLRAQNAVNAMVRVGNFPHQKGLEAFDFSFQPSVDQSQMTAFVSREFIKTFENIIFIGTSGVGKTHLATAIGLSCAKERVSTYFIKCHDLIQNLRRARLENRLEDRLKHYSKYKLLIIDELGYLPISDEDAKLFFQLVDRRYEKKSTIITTNIDFRQWGEEIFGEPKIANAILDRLLHHAHVVPIVGESYRLKEFSMLDD
ncbi:IS21-like element helper ATPase IstB [Lactococcus lactis]|uniref:IS21-like element helper ATPase IstB n=1 Tax=Lactococcus lactis TaxID=1358 RepID=UPI0021AFD583|nr:IS21-like element helper ATPase IstB [Lactococcus lactis]MCT0449091.1 AAA family ATPase [Lactococcus lactis subsp. lactis]